MKKLLLCLLLFGAHLSYGQNSFTVIVKDNDTKEPLIGATAIVEGTTIGASANLDGELTIEGIPNGKQVIVFSFVGYESEEEEFEFPFTGAQPFTMFLESNMEEMEEVVISTTRSSRTIEDVPTRMEAITAEELGEKSAMNSTNIAMLLRESTGIQMQQTSANSANQSIRIQGLDGRYTQILKDGFPLFSGFAGGLSIMQIPPLDLQQVEVIKGSASTLYGGGAIAGLVNLVSKQPDEEAPELNLMLNQTTAMGSTANLFWGQRGEKVGFTLYGSANNQEVYDPNSDNYSDIPQVQSLTINPKLFWYPAEETKLWIGLNSSFEERFGGNISAIEGAADSLQTFTEFNDSKRLASQFHFEHEGENGGLFTVRNSVSYFDRDIAIPTYNFRGEQLATFSEFNWIKERESAEWILGANFVTEDFTDRDTATALAGKSYSYQTAGAFAQNTWSMSDKLILETGFRADYNTTYGLFALPRVSMLMKPSEKLSMRVGGGLGYKLPTIFTEDAEVISFANIQPIDVNSVEAERSIGGNFDVNYKTIIGEKVVFTINQLFFYTQLSNSLVLEADSLGTSNLFSNADGDIKSMGTETNIKFTRGNFKLFLQYAFVDVQLTYRNVNSQKPLTPKHNAGAVFMYEEEDNWRVGIEAYYTGQQFRSDYSQTRDYWVVGLMGMKKFDHLTVFLNFENFTDTRQSRYQSMIVAPNTNPSGTEIWAPTDGFVANAGIIIKLFKEQEEE